MDYYHNITKLSMAQYYVKIQSSILAIMYLRVINNIVYHETTSHL